MKHPLLAAGFVLLNGLLIGAVSAQNTSVSCQALLRVALENTASNCAAMGPDQVCYGSESVVAGAASGVTDFQFDAPGSLESVDRVQSVQVRTLDFAQSQYGIAEMTLRARPDHDASATLLMIGDADLTNAVETLPMLDMTVNQGINVRLGPDASTGLVGSLRAGAVVTATGRGTDFSGQEWIRIVFSEHRDGIGWVIGWALNSTGDRNTLARVQPGDPILLPMRSVVLHTGYSDAPCQPAPDSGTLIQTPSGTSMTLIVNDASLELSGTAFLQTEGDTFSISNLVGDLSVSAEGRKQAVPVGAMTQLPLDSEGHVAGEPSFPDSYIYTVLERLPFDLLPEPVDLVAPLAAPQIVDFFKAEFPQNGLWTVSGEPAACFPSTTHPAVFSSDWLLGTGTLTFAEDHSSFTFTGGPGGLSTHTLVGEDTYLMVTQVHDGKTTFTTHIVDPQTLVTNVDFAYVTGAGNCTSSVTWTWKPAGG